MCFSGYKDWNNSAYLQEMARWIIPKRIVSLGSVNMKRTMKKLLLFLAAGLLAVSCVININGGVFVGSCTEEGIDYTEVREVGPFRALSAGIPCNVYFEQADKQEVRVESTEEFAGKVITEVEDGTLKLKLEEGRYPKLILRMVITAPDIESLHLSGSGNLINEGGLRVGGDLALRVSGSGGIRMGDIDSKDFSAHCSGSGSLRLPQVACAESTCSVSGSGSVRIGRMSCTGLEAGTSGSGSVNVDSLVSKGDVSARVSGSGRVRLEEVDVDGNMQLKTTGAGGITVNGSCHEVDATTSGSGSISGKLSYTNIRSHSSGSGRVRL